MISHSGRREARAREIHRLSALASVVAIVPETGADVATAVRAGARGVVFEDRLGEALVPTVGAVRAGQLAVPRQFHRHAVKPRLSYRERQVLGLMAIGVGNAGIATAVGLETSTVKSHVSAALAKLGVRTRGEAAAVVVDPDEGFGPGILDLPIVQRERTAVSVPSQPHVHSSAVEAASR
ncbi:MAG: LuxR C-terminal-related transcriptional regulator [Solirubrobacterales bacterium]